MRALESGSEKAGIRGALSSLYQTTAKVTRSKEAAGLLLDTFGPNFTLKRASVQDFSKLMENFEAEDDDDDVESSSVCSEISTDFSEATDDECDGDDGPVYFGK